MSRSRLWLLLAVLSTGCRATSPKCVTVPTPWIDYGYVMGARYVVSTRVVPITVCYYKVTP